MPPPVKSYVRTPFGQIHLRRVDGPGPPIVLLHRTPADSASFDRLLNRLSGHVAAVALDTPGFGQSFRPSGSPTTVDYGQWFLAALDGLGIDRFHLFAHHTGTHFAAEMAKAAPLRVLSLTLSGVLYLKPEERASVRRQIGHALPIDAQGDYLASAWKTMKDLFPTYDPHLIHSETLGALASPEGRDQAFDAILAQDFKGVLGAVGVPVRILQAQDDPLGFCLGRVRADYPDIPIELHATAGMAAPERQSGAIARGLLSLAGAQAQANIPEPAMSMRQFQLSRTPTGFDLGQIPGEPPSPEAGEVVIRVHAVSLNRRDSMIRDLSYPAFSDHLTPLSDAAGEVVAVGPDVVDVQIGDRVTSTFFQNWPDGRITLPAVMSALGAGGRGVLADYVALSAGGIAPIPAGLTYEEAAALPCAGVTAWSALFTHGRLQAGDWVLVEGTGGVALFGLQLAKAAGAKVAVISSSDEKLERCKAMGADVTINYVKTPNWEVAVREATGGAGVAHVLELGGAGTLQKSAATLGVGGHLALIGALTGFGGELSAAGLIMGAQRVTAVTCGSRAEHLALTAFIAAHGIKPVIDATFELAAIEQAYARSDAGAFGKVVVKLA